MRYQLFLFIFLSHVDGNGMLVGPGTHSDYVWLPKSIVGKCGNIPISILVIHMPFDTTSLFHVCAQKAR